jgi:hypothetical protein
VNQKLEGIAFHVSSSWCFYPSEVNVDFSIIKSGSEED